MPYTIPPSADTTEQAILAVASAVKGEQVTGGDGSVNTALDILADALAGENVQVPMTQQGAILALAQYVGGGVDVGALAFVGGTETAPTVGGERLTYPIIAIAKIGDVAIYDGSPYGDGVTASGGFAAGLTLTTDVVPADFADTMGAYVCTVDESNQYATIVPWGGTLTREDAEYEGDPAYRWTFTMPELQEGELLVLYPHLAD